jgi:hypothetical protein
MTARLEVLRRPAPDADYRAPSRYRPAGFLIALLGLALAMVTFVLNLVAGNLKSGVPPESGEFVDAEQILAVSWGLNTTAFAIIKIAIAVVLIGIIARLWMRVDSVKAALAVLTPHDDTPIRRGSIETEFGPATASDRAPRPLRLHTMAKRMWAPMILMGAMAVFAGLLASFAWASRIPDGTQQAAVAWTQGLQFLGEGLILGGIAFLLGTILAGLREGGGEVQESLGVTVQTLKMPVTAKLFVGLMMLGVMLAVAQFVLYVVAATVDGGATFASWLAWLGPTRELALGLILAGITLALVAIGNVLAFQFTRIRAIAATGRQAVTPPRGA